MQTYGKQRRINDVISNHIGMGGLSIKSPMVDICDISNALQLEHVQEMEDR